MQGDSIYSGSSQVVPTPKGATGGTIHAPGRKNRACDDRSLPTTTVLALRSTSTNPANSWAYTTSKNAKPVASVDTVVGTAATLPGSKMLLPLISSSGFRSRIPFVKFGSKSPSSFGQVIVGVPQMPLRYWVGTISSATIALATGVPLASVTRTEYGRAYCVFDGGS